jgi:uncharacterized protein (TIGR02145 family)
MKLTRTALGAFVLYVAMMFAACDDSSATAAEERVAGESSSSSLLVSSDGRGDDRLSSNADERLSSGTESSSSKMNIVRSSSSFSFASCSTKVNWKYLNPAISYGEIIDDRDDQPYKTVKIGNQEWMAENLNFWPERKKCDSLEFGYSVTWDRAMDSAGIYSENGKGCGFYVKCTPVYPVRGLCPAGWHLPTSAEWDTLFYFVGDSVGFADPSSIALRSPHLWRVGSNSVGQDLFGFCVLPSHKNRANFWTSEGNIYSSREAENAFVSEHSVGHNWKYADPYVLEKVDYLAIRCVKD